MVNPYNANNFFICSKLVRNSVCDNTTVTVDVNLVSQRDPF